MELGGIDQKHSPKVFLISSTHGAESGPLRAFLATLKIFKSKNVIKKNKKILNDLYKICDQLIKKHNLEESIKIVNSDWIISFIFLELNKASNRLRTLFIQEMIKNKVLFQGSFVPSFSHGKKELFLFQKAFSKSLAVINLANKFGINKYLRSKIIKPVFTKYN